jgi:hypothetical protein
VAQCLSPAGFSLVKRPAEARRSAPGRADPRTSSTRQSRPLARRLPQGGQTPSTIDRVGHPIVHLTFRLPQTERFKPGSMAPRPVVMGRTIVRRAQAALFADSQTAASCGARASVRTS